MNPLILLTILGVAAYLIYENGGFGGAAAGCAAPSGGGCAVGQFPSNWLSYGAAYVPELNAVEQQYGLPANLLCAVAYAESGFNPAAVNASSGATGMFQLLPTYYPDAGASWQDDAVSAAQALSSYYQSTGNWQDALAAYNWGPGNLAGSCGTYCGLPAQTQSYVTNIVAAVPAATGPLVA
jgi:membrane-bound lytic murein transglycosylase D